MYNLVTSLCPVTALFSLSWKGYRLWHFNSILLPNCVYSLQFSHISCCISYSLRVYVKVAVKRFITVFVALAFFVLSSLGGLVPAAAVFSAPTACVHLVAV